MRHQYCELPPPRVLSDRLVCLWTQRIDDHGGTYRHSILPDGCVDIVWIGEGAPVVAGPATQRIVVELAPGTRIIGARLRPGWVDSFLGLPADNLLNQHVPLAEIWGSSAEPFIEPVLSHTAFSARLAQATSALTARWATRPCPDPAILRAITWLAAHPTGRVQDLARAIGFSDRQLQRRFRAAVGFGPKMCQRILRFHRLLASSRSDLPRGQKLGRLAYRAGYVDQAHMSREVRALAGESPRHLLGEVQSTLVMSDLFNTSAGFGR